jgi:hypothetical protein
MFTQLDPPLHMETPKGPGWAHFVIDYGPESALMWVVFMDADGACWAVPNWEVRLSFNWSLGRRNPKRHVPKAKAKGKGKSAPAKPEPASANLRMLPTATHSKA